MIVKNNFWKFAGATLFVFTFFWFYFPGEYVLIANQDHKLFFTTLDHFLSFADHPGGILEYLGNFFTQFYRFRVAGALILAAIVTAGFYATAGLIRKNSGEWGKLILPLMASVLLIGMHNHYPHQIHYSLGLVSVIALVRTVPEDPLKRRIYSAIAIPVIYYISGGYVWFYGALVIARFFALDRKKSVEIILLNLVYPAVLIGLGAGFVYIDPLKILVFSPLPSGQSYPVPQLPLIFMVYVVMTVIFVRVSNGQKFPGSLWKRVRSFWRIAFIIIPVIAGIFLIMIVTFNKRNKEFFTLEKLAVQEDWDELLNYADQHPSTNLFGTFYTNLALAKKGMLCTSLFNYPQVFGTDGLCFRWDSKAEILKRGSDFFWAVHFVNEAQHWSFESMVVEGFTRRNLKRLIQTELTRGNYIVARKYIRLLQKTLFDRGIASYYLQFIDQPVTIQRDNELGPVAAATINHDFFAEGADLEKNLRKLVWNDPLNRMAFEYLMALLMLEKKVNDIISLVPDYISLNNGVLPRLLQECLLVDRLLNPEIRAPDISLDQNTIAEFNSYLQILRHSADQNDAARRLFPVYGNTFWFYMNFANTAKK